MTNQVPTPKIAQCFAPLFLPHCVVSSHALVFRVTCVLSAVCLLRLKLRLFWPQGDFGEQPFDSSLRFL